jgi:SpoVK/Ycf46/Vps4 family AAA+-type ATPase
LHISVRNAGYYLTLEKEMKSLLKIAFNNSQYKGKCLKVKLADGRFRGIEIIDLPKIFDLILTPIQEKYKNNFINRVRRGSSTRYLLNGTPGSGKTETIRDIIKQLVPEVTFVIPDFTNVEDLTTILEACEIFENAVIIMDDIDLFLGSREKGSYTRLLGEFLAFFDGVKKRSISLLASTNDKGLVDAAAERPGRFNLTLDYTYLTDEQIIKVCEIHLPVEYQKPEIYNAFKKIDGKKGKVTGAFIANLAENIKEMSFGDDNWGIAETIELIEDSYKGFYSSQIKKEEKVGFLKDN